MSGTLACASSISQAAATAVPAIQCTNLRKKFGQRVCVDDLSLTVRSGELYALLGDNGAGKTTTINMLTTLLQPSGGTFSICGFDGVNNTEQAKRAFGVVSQEVAIYGELSAYENLEFIADLYCLPRQQKQTRIAELLNQTGLLERAHDPAGRFSAGMQRKLAIAIALVRQPRVIFMDEPTVGLDPLSRRQIWQTLANLKKQGVTILLTTHYLDEAELLADRIGIIRQGRLIVEGSIEELRMQLRTTGTITVGLRGTMSERECVERAGGFASAFGMNVHVDEFHRTLIFTLPADAVLPKYLDAVLDWLKREDIDFEKFATREPSLEEMFVSIDARMPSVALEELRAPLAGRKD